jgi:hypothetical protein
MMIPPMSTPSGMFLRGFRVSPPSSDVSSSPANPKHIWAQKVTVEAEREGFSPSRAREFAEPKM